MSPCAGFEVTARSFRQRAPHFDAWRENIREAAWHHANDEEWNAIEIDGASDDRSVAPESSRHEGVAQNHDVGASGSIFSICERAACHYIRPEHTEIVRGDALAFESFGQACSAERRLPPIGGGEHVERSAPRAQLVVRSERRGHRRSFTIAVVDGDDAARVREGK